MTTPGGYMPPQEPGRRAAAVIGSAMRTIGARQQGLPFPPSARERPVLTEDEKQGLREAVEAGATCEFCGAVHVGGSTAACPRLAAFRLDGDRRVVEGSFWPDGQWDASRLLYAEDAEPGEGARA